MMQVRVTGIRGSLSLSLSLSRARPARSHLAAGASDEVDLTSTEVMTAEMVEMARRVNQALSQGQVRFGSAVASAQLRAVHDLLR
jgi:hypothetical protein